MTDKAQALIEEYDRAAAAYQQSAEADEAGTPSDTAHDAYQDTIWALVPDLVEALREQAARIRAEDTATTGFEHLIDAAVHQATGKLDWNLCAYVTDGRTWVIAVDDVDRPHDLVAVLPVPAEGSRVAVLNPDVNPSLVHTLRSHFDANPEV